MAEQTPPAGGAPTTPTPPTAPETPTPEISVVSLDGAPVAPAATAEEPAKPRRFRVIKPVHIAGAYRVPAKPGHPIEFLEAKKLNPILIAALHFRQIVEVDEEGKDKPFVRRTPLGAVIQKRDDRRRGVQPRR